jgi:Autographiviridae RNA polymerase
LQLLYFARLLDDLVCLLQVDTRLQRLPRNVASPGSKQPRPVYDLVTHIVQVRLWLQDRQHTIKLETDLSDIDRDAAARGASPNFVHACDAAHLMLTVDGAVAEGITSIATVHDCFGCLPSRAERFRRIIREQFVRMYEENDVLAQVLEQARKDLNEPSTKRMPSAPPSRGSLDIKNVLEAVFAFA